MTRKLQGKSLAIMLMALVLTAGCNSQDSNQWRQLASQLRDSDGDGWLDENKNQRIDLIVGSIETPAQSQFEEISLVVDDRIILDKSPVSTATAISPEVVATSRCAGQWFIGQPQHYKARVKSFQANHSTENASVGFLPFENRTDTFTKTLTLDGKDFTFHYRSRITTFADPSPQDSAADSDADGINDLEESQLAREDNRIGNPVVRDILVVAAFTNPRWALTKRSVERITTAFLVRGFNFLIADLQSDLLSVTPGQILLPDGNQGALVIPTENRGVAISEVAAVRPRHIPDEFQPFTHLLIAADNTPDASFGISNIPGRNVVIRSHLFGLGPDPFGLEYQAKDAMHELGHNFGLCHPNQSNASCPTGPIPPGERNGAASCMGSPTDDGGLFTGVIPNGPAITNAFSRPLDYSPTQWINIAPQSSRGM